MSEVVRPLSWGQKAVCPHCGADYGYHDWERHRPRARTGKPRCGYRRPSNTAHGQLVQSAARWLRGKQKCSVVFAEPTVLTHVQGERGWGGYMPDAIGWRPGFSLMVEAKTTLADLKREARKRIDAPGNKRWLLVPREIGDGAAPLVPDLFPEWGLLVAHGRFFRELVEAPFRQLSPEAAEVERQILIASVARHQKGVLWLGKEYRFETMQERNTRSRGSAAQKEVPPQEEDAPSALPSAVRSSSG